MYSEVTMARRLQWEKRNLAAKARLNIKDEQELLQNDRRSPMPHRALFPSCRLALPATMPSSK